MTSSDSSASSQPEVGTQTRICTAIASRPLGGLRAAALDEFKWQPGQTIRIRFLEGDTDLCKRAQNAALAWTGPGMANLSLAFVDTGDADIRITFQQNNRSWSYIGTDSANHPGNPTINFGWLTPASTDVAVRSVVLHEFGHMLGLIHEHQNPDHAIDWNRSAVIRDLSGPPNNWDEATIQHNLFDLYDPAKLTKTILDPQSIMMYQIPASWTLDGFSTGFNDDLSANDRVLIAQVYPT